MLLEVRELLAEVLDLSWRQSEDEQRDAEQSEDEQREEVKRERERERSSEHGGVGRRSRGKCQQEGEGGAATP